MCIYNSAAIWDDAFTWNWFHISRLHLAKYVYIAHNTLLLAITHGVRWFNEGHKEANVEVGGRDPHYLDVLFRKAHKILI